MSQVVEDVFVEKTTQHPQVYRVCRSRNRMLTAVELNRAVSKISGETNLELKRISTERAALNRDLHKLLLDKAVYSRSDVTSNLVKQDRRKSIELEDVNLRAEKERNNLIIGKDSQHLTAFVTYGRSQKASDLKKGVAISEEQLDTLSDLRQYQFWEGDPGAINSVRRGLKPRSVQLTDLSYSRSRRFDQINREIELQRGSKESRISREHTNDFKPPTPRLRTTSRGPTPLPYPE